VIPGFFVMGVWLLLPPIFFFFLRPHVAALITILSAMMFLPEGMGFNLPILPSMGKDELGSLSAMVWALVFAPAAIQRARPLRGPEMLVVVLFVGTFISFFLNQNSMRMGPVVIRGIEMTSIVAAVLSDAMTWLIPFLLGRALFNRSEALRDLFVVLIFAGLGYSLLMLFEIRMSPQLHRWTYGYMQHSFAQAVRDGGAYRPMVYMRHGLNLALFTIMFMTSAWILMKTRYRMPMIHFVPKWTIAAYLTVILFLCRSTGALLYGLLIVPLVYFASSRLQTLAAVAVAALALSYPAIRVAQMLPVEELVQAAEEQFGERRAHSFAGRLRTEEQMTIRIQQKPVFGWGSAGRAMMRDAETGELMTTFDGAWLILFVRTGIVGFVCVFGLLLWPVFNAFRRIGGIRSKQDRAMIAGLSLMVAIHGFDLIPNATTEGYLTLLSGALAGAVPGILREQSLRDAQRRDAASGSPSGSAPGAGGRGGPMRPGEVPPTLGKSLLGPSSTRRPKR
jgi:hypothetical protein